MKNKNYIWILACILIIVGAILQITHIAGASFVLIIGFTLGLVGHLLEARKNSEKKEPKSKVAKVLIFISMIAIILGAILEITHTWEAVNIWILIGGYFIGAVYYLIEGTWQGSFSAKSQK